MPREYDWEADAVGCYNLCISEMKKRMEKTGKIPPALLGTGPHSQRLIEEARVMEARMLLGECVTSWLPSAAQELRERIFKHLGEWTS